MAEPIISYACTYEPKPGKRCGAPCKARRDDLLAMLAICAPCQAARFAKGVAEQRKAGVNG